MKKDIFRNLWKEDELLGSKALNYSHIDGRWSADDLPWDYRDVLLKYLKKTDMLLDMGAGDGEFLLTLDHPFELTGITEGYDPNYELCKIELEPLGITVKKSYRDTNLPYEDEIFDVVHNRHSSYDVDEVYRVLKPGGYFITQQIGGQNDFDLSNRLIENYTPALPDYNLDMGVDIIKNKLELIEEKEGYAEVRFYDVGAVVGFAKKAKTEFPNFSVDNNFDKLLELQEELEERGYVSTTQHRFMIVAQKKKDKE